MTWRVFYFDINRGKVGAFNIFDHGRFREDVIQNFKKYLTKEEFVDHVERDLFYYFWCKAEWEIWIDGWIGERSKSGVKVDVYNQVKLNWDVFTEYLWSQREEVLNG